MPANSGFNSKNKFVNQVRSNTKSDLIEITEDKLENILLKHLNKSTIINSWVTPLSLFLTILTVLLTSEFKEFGSLDKSDWKAFFTICLIVTLIWTIVSTIKAIRCSKKSSIKFLINEIKNHEE